MIGVSEDQEAQVKANLDELHRSILGFYGRVLQVRTRRLDFDYGYSYDGYADDPSYVDHIYENSSGKIVGVNLSSRYRTGTSQDLATAELRYKFLEVILEGGQKLSVELDSSELSVLQEDTGQWKLVHRGNGWKEPSTNDKKDTQ